jgi:hypothetical protein
MLTGEKAFKGGNHSYNCRAEQLIDHISRDVYFLSWLVYDKEIAMRVNREFSAQNLGAAHFTPFMAGHPYPSLTFEPGILIVNINEAVNPAPADDMVKSVTQLGDTIFKIPFILEAYQLSHLKMIALAHATSMLLRIVGSDDPKVCAIRTELTHVTAGIGNQGNTRQYDLYMSTADADRLKQLLDQGQDLTQETIKQLERALYEIPEIAAASATGIIDTGTFVVGIIAMLLGGLGHAASVMG